jgi:hypothetical protein
LLAALSQSGMSDIAIARAIEPRSMPHAASVRLPCANARSAISMTATRRIRRRLMGAPFYTQMSTSELAADSGDDAVVPFRVRQPDVLHDCQSPFSSSTASHALCA